jgi:hypothetical protein
VPFFLQPEKHYVGAAWYQRDLEIPADWQGKRVVLTLERPHWETRLWLDGKLIGTNDSLATPHVYDLGTGLAPGRHTLTIRVDNRIIVAVGDWSHSVSDHTQGNWNGVVGRIELSATSPVWIEDLQAYPHVATKSVTVKGRIGNTTGKAGRGKLELVHEPDGVLQARVETLEVSWESNGGSFETTFDLHSGATPWDEFNPRLYHLEARLDRLDSKSVTFGLREIATAGRQFVLNGRKAFFRGTLECCIFPLTGHPPTDVDSWKKVIRACKAHGLNHIRFHSWCPPEAAFVAADELGFYYQVECGVWTNPGDGKPIDDWIYRESERIVRAYGNHPSFVLLTHGNEPHGPNHQKFLAGWVNFWKQRDPRRLVTSGSAYPQLPENQYHVYHGPRGPGGWLGKDYRGAIASLDVPVIVHEMGQWCVYPNFDEIKKYTGPLKPKNFEIFRDSLAEHGLLDQWRDFLRASGKLQALCYKEEIEAALRTPGVGGFQLLDLHDFPGQGTALVGVLDPFWEEKGYIAPEEFRQFCNPTVPLARLLKRTWTTDGTLTADVEIAHFGAAPLENVVPQWRLTDERGRAVASGEWGVRTIPVDQGIALGQVRIDLSKLPAPRAYNLTVETKDRAVRNSWTVWVYPPKAAAAPADVLLTANLDDKAQARLAEGGKVLLLLSKLPRLHPKLGFEPIFWNRYMFNTQGRQTLGLLCDPRHPALARFPTEFFQDWQWNDIVTQASGFVMDALPKDLRPIVQVIDDWNTNRRLGLVFECRVGPGKLLVCAADLEQNLDQRPAARQLRHSLLAYMAGPQFDPKVAVAGDALAQMLQRTGTSKLVQLGAKLLSADSEDRENGNTADRAIDGDPDTIWHTRWQPRNDPMPHQLILDLGREVTLKGITYLPRQDMANGRIAEAEVFCSTDPNAWPAPSAEAKWPDTGELQTLQFQQPVKARYLKVVAKAEVNGNPFAAIAEVDVVTDEK